MNDRIKTRMPGLREQFAATYQELIGAKQITLGAFAQAMTREMQQLNFDETSTDEWGNIIGVIKGYRKQGDMLIIAPMDIEGGGDSAVRCRRPANGDESQYAEALASIYTGAILKRSIAAMSGDLIVCIVPRFKPCSFGTQNLFENFLKGRTIKGAILAEPTSLDINLGNKGLMEYEIVIRGLREDAVLDNSDFSMMNTMYPLIKNLGMVSKKFPNDRDFGSPTLHINEILYNREATDSDKAFHVAVDRSFVPDETSGEILERAKNIAANSYQDQPGTNVAVRVKTETKRIGLNRKLEITNEIAPWRMDGYHPFVLESLEVLKENLVSASVGYWKTRITEGSITYSRNSIPTLGYGAGAEDKPFVLGKTVELPELENSIMGKAMIVYRGIGFPTFGWSDEEI